MMHYVEIININQLARKYYEIAIELMMCVCVCWHAYV